MGRGGQWGEYAPVARLGAGRVRCTHRTIGITVGGGTLLPCPQSCGREGVLRLPTVYCLLPTAYVSATTYYSLPGELCGLLPAHLVLAQAREESVGVGMLRHEPNGVLEQLARLAVSSNWVVGSK